MQAPEFSIFASGGGGDSSSPRLLPPAALPGAKLLKKFDQNFL